MANKSTFEPDRADELYGLLDTAKNLAVQFVHAGSDDAYSLRKGYGHQVPGDTPRTTLVESHHPSELSALLNLKVPDEGLGAADFENTASNILNYSVNTSTPAFMDKLYSAPSPVGIAAELLTATLNANAHVYNVSPALTHVEKFVASSLARLFGLTAPQSGGITVSGGSAANTMALLVARNMRFPELKKTGIAGLSKPMVVFMSEEAHYSTMSAAQMLGIGSVFVRKVKTMSNGEMDPKDLEAEIERAIQKDCVPLFVCATAGTTVRGAFDPLDAIGDIANKYSIWLHVDACWGGAAVFSEILKSRLNGCEKADSIAFNPHKMLGVPLTCSFLLAKDLRTFWIANRQEAGYLFHEDIGLGSSPGLKKKMSTMGLNDISKRLLNEAPAPRTVLDLASFTTQCGRRSDALKFYLHWRYYGTQGMSKHVEAAHASAQNLALLIEQSANLRLVGKREDIFAQVCFYYLPGGQQVSDGAQNSIITRRIVENLLERGWMVDCAQGTRSSDGRGENLRVVCNRYTTNKIVEGLVKAVLEVGMVVMDQIRSSTH